ncbi:hypothetical protein F5148DRAFT_1190694, partial [Russula earlei]
IPVHHSFNSFTHYDMSTDNKVTAEGTHPSGAAGLKKTISGIGGKAAGAVNVIHGAGEIIRGEVLEAADRGRGVGKGSAIAAAGRDEVERGLRKLEGKPATTSAAGAAPDNNRGGVDDGGSAASRWGQTSPRAPATAPRADSTAEKAKVDPPVNEAVGSC